MEFDPKIHHRRSIRMRGFDYCRSGWYSITVVVQNRVCILGDINEGQMCPNSAGQMIESVWKEIPVHYPGIGIDAFQIMPNHFHGIITIGMNQNLGRPQGAAPTLALSDVLQRYKTMTTRLYIEGVHEKGWQPFRDRLWQRNYYEYIVRNDRDLNRVRQYILTNPEQWADDQENPLRPK